MVSQMQREGKGWAKGIAKASYGAVYANVVCEHGTFVDATGARIGDRNAKKAVLRWQRSLEAGLQPPIGAPYNLAQNETVTREMLRRLQPETELAEMDLLDLHLLPYDLGELPSLAQYGLGSLVVPRDSSGELNVSSEAPPSPLAHDGGWGSVASAGAPGSPERAGHGASLIDSRSPLRSPQAVHGGVLKRMAPTVTANSPDRGQGQMVHARLDDLKDDNQRASLTKDGWDLSTCIPGCNGACDAVNYATRRSKDKAEANKPSRLFCVKALTVPIMQRHTLCRTRPSCDVCHRRIGGWRLSDAARQAEARANKDMLSRMAAS